MSASEILWRIQARLKELNLTEAAASKLARGNPHTLRQFRRRVESGDAKGLSFAVAVSLAPVLETSVNWLLYGEDGPEGNSPGNHLREFDVAGLPVLGSIGAGLWRDTTVLDEEAEMRMLPVARDPRFPRARQYCLEVRGDSADKDFPDHSFVTCVDFEESGLPLREHMTLHVERRRDGGALVEATLKRIETVNGITQLVSRSNNPKYQSFPIPRLEKGHYIARMGETEIVVKGIVIGKYQEVPV